MRKQDKLPFQEFWFLKGKKGVVIGGIKEIKDGDYIYIALWSRLMYNFIFKMAETRLFKS